MKYKNVRNAKCGTITSDLLSLEDRSVHIKFLVFEVIDSFPHASV